MKTITRKGVVCILIFIFVCVGVVSLLQAFTEVTHSRTMVEWNQVSVLQEDGTWEVLAEVNGETEEERIAEEEAIFDIEHNDGRTYRYSAVLSGDLRDPQLNIRLAYCEVSIWMEGELIYTGSTIDRPNLDADQIEVALPADYDGQTLVLEYRFTGSQEEYGSFLLQVTSLWVEEQQVVALSNYYGIRIGLYGFMLVVLCAIFLVSVMVQRVNWSVPILILAVFCWLFEYIVRGEGIYYFPEHIYEFFVQSYWNFIPPVLLIVYMLLNVKRGFVRKLAWLILGTGVILVGAYFVSLQSGGQLANYFNLVAGNIFYHGNFRDVVYWGTIALIYAGLLISAWEVITNLLADRVERQTLLLKEDLMTENMEILKRKEKETIALRHEIKNAVALMNLLYQENEMGKLGEYLQQTSEMSAALSGITYTEHPLLNMILQNYSARAEEQKTMFEVKAVVPPTLSVSDGDLSSLLMNLLNNALEACQKLENTAERHIRIQIELKESFLAIRCENTYAGEIQKDEDGNLRTIKQDQKTHGYGIKQMEQIAARYHSIIDISYTDKVFVVQTALQLGGVVND